MGKQVAEVLKIGVFCKSYEEYFDLKKLFNRLLLLVINRLSEKLFGDTRNSEAEHDLIYEKQLGNDNAGRGYDEKLYIPDLNKFSFEIVDKTINNNASACEEEVVMEKEIIREIVKSKGFQ